MSFAQRETSIADGAPLLLFEFSRGSKVWRYTSCGRDYDLSGIVYTDVPGMIDDAISQTGEPQRDSVRLVVPRSLEIVQHYVGLRPSTRTRLAIRACHYGDTDAPVEWIGYVAAIARKKTGQCEITCQSMEVTFDRPGLRLCWSRGCPYTVYDDQCGVNLDSFKAIAVMTVLDGQHVTAPPLNAAPEADYYIGGMIRWTNSDGVDESRGLDDFDPASGVVSVYGGTQGMETGQLASFHPGCGYTVTICESRFGNRLNCGLHRGMPGKSPFDGTAAF